LIILLSSRGSKIAEEILVKMAEAVATEVAVQIGTELGTRLAQGLSSWWDNNFNYAGRVYPAARVIPSTNGEKPLEHIPFEEFYRRVTTAHQQREQYRQYLNYIIQRATNLWMRLSPQERYQLMVNSGYYQGSTYNYDQIVANLLSNLLNMSMYR
jgi:hypothetical protein